tara:strand:- start:3337 stop:3741 length:405 start_codon:yes stop_codon:yes gene_type:complete
MATVTNILNQQTARGSVTTWHSLWDSTTQLTDSVVVDLSAQSDGKTNNLKLDKIWYQCTAGIQFTLEFDDDSSDEFIHTSVLGHTTPVEVDYTDNGRLPGLSRASSGGTSDIQLTSISAASGDEIMLIVWYVAS